MQLVASATTGTQGIVVTPDPIGNKSFRKSANPRISAISSVTNFTQEQVEKLNGYMSGEPPTSTRAKGVDYKEYSTSGRNYAMLPARGPVAALKSFISSPEDNCLTFVKETLGLETLDSPITSDYVSLLPQIDPYGYVRAVIPRLQFSHPFNVGMLPDGQGGPPSHPLLLGADTGAGVRMIGHGGSSNTKNRHCSYRKYKKYKQKYKGALHTS